MSLSFTALLFIAHGIVSDTSCRPVEYLKHATMLVPSFALRPLHPFMLRLPFFLVVQCPLPPSPPPTLQPPLFPMRLFST